jgi:hypothetical protein
MRNISGPVLLGLGALALAGCEGFGFGGPAASMAPSPERVAAFENMVAAAGCELPHTDNDSILDPAGFSDAEASAISQQLLAEGRATLSPSGNLVLTTGACV